MAVFKIFPNKDATIYSQFPNKNTGLDEILEINKNLDESDVIVTAEVSRILLKFSNTQLQSLYSLIGNNDHKFYLRLFLAKASSIPVEYTLFCYPLAENWEMGTGKYLNFPETTDGVSWNTLDGVTQWTTSSFPAGVTASYDLTPGGGSWYTSSFATQSFDYLSDKDILFDVTGIIEQHYSSSLSLGGIENNGLIIKTENEFNSSSLYNLSYFSRDTHTIYPPCLELRWNDSTYNTGSLTEISDTNFVLTLANNKGEFKEKSVHTFKINVRDKFPARQFSTSSVYLNTKRLPSSSYWSLKDAFTEETVIDFDDTFTKISFDSNVGNNFTMHMDGLEPERNYRLVFKVVKDQNTMIIDDNFYFKIVR